MPNKFLHQKDMHASGRNIKVEATFKEIITVPHDGRALFVLPVLNLAADAGPLYKVDS